MKKDNKRFLTILIYLRYILPIVALLAMFAMLFLPSYRFVFDGDAGTDISVMKLLSISWEETRTVLFGTGDTSDAAVSFSRTLFTVIIVTVVLFLISLAVSVWTAIVAFKCFFSDDEEASENWRLSLCVFLPNRIVLCILSSLGLLIAMLPHFMPPLYSWTYSKTVRVALVAPSALIIGGVLILGSIILSIICAPIEKRFDADIFKKKVSDKALEEEASDSAEDEEIDVDDEQREQIRQLFRKDEDDKNNTKKG